MKLPYIEAGEIVTTHGVRGEIKLLSWLDSPEMLCEFDRCRISGREYVMDSVRVQKTLPKSGASNKKTTSSPVDITMFTSDG